MNNKVLKVDIETRGEVETIKNDKEKLFFYKDNAFDSFDYIETLNKGIGLAKKGYRIVKLAPKSLV